GEDIPASQYGRGSGYASGVYPASGPDFLSLKFTGKERDWESGLDFSQARYYSPWQGRFGGVDPENAGADSGSPQTYHGYAYVTNSPLVNTDPDGLLQRSNSGNDGSPPPDNSLFVWLLQEDLRMSALFARKAAEVGAAVEHWINQPRDSGCLAGTAGVGASIGTAVGAGVGAAGGTVAGTVAGSEVPIVGNILGGLAGGGLGIAKGGAIGGGLGATAGLGIGLVVCSISTGPSGSGGRASTAESTGRTAPKDLKEQLAMEQAKSDPAAGTEVPLRKGMTDSRWPGSQGWHKMAQNINGVEIHYVWNRITGAVADFKFVM
ncbi:MAG: RHS repeat-associated core domain-containing protein, partial [Bryobacteraceae bacterium]